jgi:capsular exopolysaccharide synthesis family protein
VAQNDPGEKAQPSRSLTHRNSSDAALDLASYEQFASDGDDDGLDFESIWHIFWSRRYWILGAGAVGLAIALVYSLLQTPLYRATASLELNPPTIPILTGQGQGGDDLVVPSQDWQFLATQYGLLKSNALGERVAQDLGLASKDVAGSSTGDPKTRLSALGAGLAGGLDVKPVPDSRLVELSYTSPDPAEAARIVNGFADAFLESTLDRRYEATGKARIFLEKRLKTARDEVNEAERQLVAYAKANNIILLSTEGEGGETGTSSLTGSSLSSLNAALAVAQQKRIAAEQRYRQAGSITEVNASTAGLRQEKAKLETEYREKSTFLKDDYPDMVRLKSRIEAINQEIKREAGTSSNSLRAEYQAALAEENALRGRVNQLSGNALNERERSIQYNMLQRELDTKRSLYATLLERFNQVGVASGIGTAQAAIVDRGSVPGAPFSPNIPRNLMLGLFLGLGLGAAFAFAYELITDTIRTPDDVREKLKLAPLGVIPAKKSKENLAELLDDHRSPIYEAYSSLQATLQFSTSQGLPHSILVTSSQPAEGKSTTSLVLARLLAESGRKVLLLDADMRKPSFVVEEQVDIGLTRVLTTEDEPRKHVLKTSNSNLWLMPSGPVPPNPTHLLASQRMREVLDELLSFFDVVIVDGPPIHGFGDAPVLGTVCEGVLFVIESGKTRRRLALDAVSRLQRPGITILGAALTKFRAYAADYGHSYKYYEKYSAVEGRSRSSILTAQLMHGHDQGNERGEDDNDA